MPYSSVTGTGVVVAGEQCVDLTPRQVPQPLPGVAFVHGAGSNASYLLDAFGNQGKKTARIADVYPAVSGDNGGQQTWGNQLSVSRLNAYIARLNARPETVTNSYALVGDSMGGLVALNYAAQASIKPKCIVLTIPVISPEDVRANNRGGYASLVNAAYGGTYDEANVGSISNPHTMRNASKLKGIPTLIFYGTTDQICNAAITEQFIAADPTFRTGVAIVGGHEASTYEKVNYNLMMDFMKSHM